MKISTDTYAMHRRFGWEKAIKMIKEAGFDCYDITCTSFLLDLEPSENLLADDYKEKAVAVRAYSDELGIECNQAHAPYDLRADDAFELSNERYMRIVRSMEVASILGAKNIIVHAITEVPENMDFYDLNRRFYRSLLPFCEAFDIHVSVENLWRWPSNVHRAIPILCDPEEHIEFVKSLQSDRFNICVDVGHASMTDHEPQDVIRAMNANILKAVHLHDNDYLRDMHTIPMTACLNWNEIVQALKDIGYQGDFTLEICNVLYLNLSEELLVDGLNFAGKIARHLADKFEAQA